MDSSNLNEMVGGGGGVGSAIGGWQYGEKWGKMAKMANSMKMSRMESKKLKSK